MTPETAVKTWERFPNKDVTRDVLISYGFGDGGGVTRDMLKMRRASDRIPGIPHVKTSTAGEFFRKLHADSRRHPEHLFTYALLPHAGTVTEGGTIEAGCALNTPVRWMPGALREQAARPLLAVDSPNLMVDAVKPCDADPAAVILRLHECRGTRSGFTVSASRPVLRWAPCDLLENETQPPQAGPGIRDTAHPFEIKCYKLWLR